MVSISFARVRMLIFVCVGLELPRLFDPSEAEVGKNGIRDKLVKNEPGQIPQLDKKKYTQPDAVYEVAVALREYLHELQACLATLNGTRLITLHVTAGTFTRGCERPINTTGRGHSRGIPSSTRHTAPCTSRVVPRDDMRVSALACG